MVYNVDIKNIFECRFNILNPGIAKFDHFSGIGKYNVIVLFEFVRLFELGDIAAKLVLSDQVTSKQQIHRVVKRGPADAVILIFHFDVERFNIKMPIKIVNLTEYGKAFRSFPMAVFFEVSRKNLLYIFLGRFARHNITVVLPQSY